MVGLCSVMKLLYRKCRLMRELTRAKQTHSETQRADVRCISLFWRQEISDQVIFLSTGERLYLNADSALIR